MGTGTALVGRTLAGRFRVTGFIGEGAMACVYRGVQKEEPRDVAIKVMHPHLLSDRTFVGRFRREAKAAAQIRHPNSVRIFDTGVDETLLYIAMELLAGQDLFEVLEIERRLSEARAAGILAQVCDALGAAHEQGIVHRDLKPENVMVLKDASRPDEDFVKVLDFGIAKILERDIDDSSSDDAPASSSSMSVTALTHAGMVVGTPAYMSPEQCRGEKIDARSDVYSCGILLYQLVTGRLPFAGTSAMDFAVMHVRTPPTPAREVFPAVHPALDALMMRALAKFPTLRQQSAAEFGQELSALIPELARDVHRERVQSLASVSFGPVSRRQPTPEPLTVRNAEGLEDAFRTLESPAQGPAPDASAPPVSAAAAAAASKPQVATSPLEAPRFSAKTDPSPIDVDAQLSLVAERGPISIQVTMEDAPDSDPSSVPAPVMLQRIDTGPVNTPTRAFTAESLEEEAPETPTRAIADAAPEPAEPPSPPGAEPQRAAAAAAALAETVRRRRRKRSVWASEARLVPLALLAGVVLGTVLYLIVR